MPLGDIINIVGTIVTIVSMFVTIVQTKKARDYKRETALLFKKIDKHMLAERCSSIVAEVNNLSGCTNNNRGGKLSSTFSRLNTVLEEVQRFVARNSISSSERLLRLKNEINQFIILNRDNATVDVSFLSLRLNQVDIIVQRECGCIFDESASS